MATAQIDTVIRHLHKTVLRQDAAGRTDGQLLAAFIDKKDEAAFEALVHRHDSMVFGVCRRFVGNHHDAEDAFQATFLVLARKASSVRPRERLANWLHGVACRTAMKAKTTTAKRRMRETNVTEMPEPEASPQDQWHDLQPMIDQELSGLPENYRLPIILCDLEGKSIKEATQQLGWPQGTLAGRLARARKLLAKRLTRRGVVLSGEALAVVLVEKAASACVPAPLAVSTTRAAVAVAAGQAAAPSLVSAKVAALMEGVMKSMMLTKLKTVTMVLLALGMVAFGGSMAPKHSATAQQVNAQEGSAEKPPSRKADTSKSLDEQKLHGEWIANEKETNFSLSFGPGNTVRRIKENAFNRLDDTGTYSVDWSKNPHHLDLKLTVKQIDPAGKPRVMQTIMEFVEPGKLRIEMGGGDEARPKAFSDETIVLTRMEKHAIGSEQAKKDIKVAEFYRRTGKFASAHFHYQLVQIRYPGTNVAEKAKQGLEDLKKHRIQLVDGSEVWEAPEDGSELWEAPKLPPPPPMIQEAPKASRDVFELRQQVKALESRLAAVEDKGKPQPPAKTAREYEIDDDLVKFQGKWTLVLHHWKGDERDDGPVTLTVKGDACTFVRKEGTKKASWRIKLNAARQPKQIDFLGGGEKLPGIYKLEGTTLLLCQGHSGEDPPSTFAAEANGEGSLYVFRRLTPDGANERPAKVGHIMIVGNTKTEEGAILKKVPLRPGDALDYQALRTAKKNLAALNATITVIENGEDSDYKDIRVTVVER